MDELWNKNDRADALKMQANNMQSSYIENKGNGHFVIKPLPIDAQTAPVYGMLGEDVDGDGNLDIVMFGNDFSLEPYSGRHDAFNGLCLKGDGKGNFRAIPLTETGFFVKGDAKGLALIYTAKNEDILLASQNQDGLKVFAKSISRDKLNDKWISLKPDDLFAEVLYKNNKKRRLEFYYGSTYLSQSSRKIKMDKEAIKITITNFKGIKRVIK